MPNKKKQIYLVPGPVNTYSVVSIVAIKLVLTGPDYPTSNRIILFVFQLDLKIAYQLNAE
jgi:hypothetical protein